MAIITGNLSDVQTIVRNVSGKTLKFGFLPPHGQSLANNATFTVSGDVWEYWPRSTQRRWRKAFQSAIDTGLIEVRRNVRHIIHTRCSNHASVTTITAGDLVWWDSTIDTNVGSVRGAKDTAAGVSDSATAQAFADTFLGIALDSHTNAAATVNNFRVDVSPLSYHLLTCASATHQAPCLLTMNAYSGGHAITSNTVVKVTSTASEAIARCVRSDTSAATSVIAQLLSAFDAGNSAAQV